MAEVLSSCCSAPIRPPYEEEISAGMFGADDQVCSGCGNGLPPDCGKKWVVTRTAMTESASYCVDRLEWEVSDEN